MTTNTNSSNCMLNLMNALTNEQQTIQQEQITNTQLAENNANTESQIYQGWNAVIESDDVEWYQRYEEFRKGGAISDDPDEFAKEVLGSSGINAELVAQQNLDISKAQAVEGQAEAITSAAQSAAAGDSSNLQTLVQMTARFVDIATVTSNMLSSGY